MFVYTVHYSIYHLYTHFRAHFLYIYTLSLRVAHTHADVHIGTESKMLKCIDNSSVPLALHLLQQVYPPCCLGFLSQWCLQLISWRTSLCNSVIKSSFSSFLTRITCGAFQNWSLVHFQTVDVKMIGGSRIWHSSPVQVISRLAGACWSVRSDARGRRLPLVDATKSRLPSVSGITWCANIMSSSGKLQTGHNSARPYETAGTARIFYSYTKSIKEKPSENILSF